MRKCTSRCFCWMNMQINLYVTQRLLPHYPKRVFDGFTSLPNIGALLIIVLFQSPPLWMWKTYSSKELWGLPSFFLSWFPAFHVFSTWPESIFFFFFFFWYYILWLKYIVSVWHLGVYHYTWPFRRKTEETNRKKSNGKMGNARDFDFGIVVTIGRMRGLPSGSTYEERTHGEVRFSMHRVAYCVQLNYACTFWCCF